MPNNISHFDLKPVKYLFTDIDGTLTDETCYGQEGKLFDDAYSALWDLHRAGVKVIPVTGRPAGWCEMILRIWPVEAVIGENGGFYFYFDENKNENKNENENENENENKKVKREFLMSKEEQKKNREKLNLIKTQILKKVPGCDVASDQFCRIMDLAIDFKEDVSELSKEQVQKIVTIFKDHGAQAKVSSIHVNGWFGKYNKSKMIKHFSSHCLKKDFSEINKCSVFIGDSPNDEENFKLFDHSVGVKNIEEFLEDMPSKPKFITNKSGGKGFVEMVEKILLPS